MYIYDSFNIVPLLTEVADFNNDSEEYHFINNIKGIL